MYVYTNIFVSILEGLEVSSNRNAGEEYVEDMNLHPRPVRFKELSVSDMKKITKILETSENTDDTEIIIEKFNIPMSKKKILALKDSIWLNDEVSCNTF